MLELFAKLARLDEAERRELDNTVATVNSAAPSNPGGGDGHGDGSGSGGGGAGGGSISSIGSESAQTHTTAAPTSGTASTASTLATAAGETEATRERLQVRVSVVRDVDAP